MNVTIELIRKTADLPYYCVTCEPYVIGTVRVFTFQDDAPSDSIYNKERALNEARDYALVLKAGVTETRELIETL